MTAYEYTYNTNISITVIVNDDLVDYPEGAGEDEIIEACAELAWGVVDTYLRRLGDLPKSWGLMVEASVDGVGYDHVEEVTR